MKQGEGKPGFFVNSTDRGKDRSNTGKTQHAWESAQTPHDEAFKKLLQTFFAEFLELFLPELACQLDHGHTRFLQQELLVDIVGQEARQLDLLLETRIREGAAFVLVHLEPQSYRDDVFHERMFIYFSRLFERHRNEYRLIIPIAIFTMDDEREERDSLVMKLPEHDILRFQFLQVKLRRNNWRDFINSDNPVAAALLGKMRYTKKEARELRTAYLRMLLRLRRELDDARLALIMSIADLYYGPSQEEDEAIVRELREHGEEEEAREIMELMPAWKRWGYEEGIEQGIEQGVEQGRLIEKEKVARNLISLGLDTPTIVKTTGLDCQRIEAIRQKTK
ncbi:MULTISPECIES: Rpn family recombination-promoting nuclease/putative transposase [Paenibacillus]|uniref:Rpn family recombination-promoting nuclease/putative transposase n=1 Tax=Paenibacillus TaxID=44249 RepID=UPI001CA816F4|nr:MULTISPECIES: Rpn family recombination-promoting nuclease/putative transposase [Paenibacillus]MBY9076982.1 Rpn family recombination-promoting nuclease/putative transposase [Paenibacillus sp. CGMCC 1.18879]